MTRAEKARERTRQWAINNPERVRFHSFKRNLRNKFGLTVEQYYDMLKEQDNSCALCNEGCKTGKNLAVDHCHKTGTIRGLLCMNCNTALGAFEKRNVSIINVVHYLEEHNESQG